MFIQAHISPTYRGGLYKYILYIKKNIFSKEKLRKLRFMSFVVTMEHHLNGKNLKFKFSI